MRREGIFAGFGGVGAEGAWMQTLLALELSRASARGASLIVADVYKAFDQVCSPLAYALLAKAGFPLLAAGTRRFLGAPSGPQCGWPRDGEGV
eukprot:15335310-Alexandrium_andersonii.AAC.1